MRANSEPADWRRARAGRTPAGATLFASLSIEALIGKQNSDGGWPYIRGVSWTEPTAYAVMAMHAAGEVDSAARGLEWLQSSQRSDGSWPPQRHVDQSSWVTALVALLPSKLLDERAHARAIRWVLLSTGQESTSVYQFRQWLLGNPPLPDTDFPGWPWIPGTAAWVSPTCMAIFALEKETRLHPSAAIDERVRTGRRFLLSRTCQAGGWNHGSARALGYETKAYPESTGQVLAALSGVNTAEVQNALGLAAGYLAETRCADALNWLQLGLMAHHRLPESYSVPADIRYRSVRDAALGFLVAAAKEGRNVLFD
ncbi:MAG TPA: hypothetical protein VG675_08000 [Bryobacteraceae bacterium]|nr:hypothetical protein [Bryobacteraceae bacterium]